MRSAEPRRARSAPALAAIGAVAAAILIFLASCGLVDLSRLELTSNPSERMQILAADEAIWIEFSIPPGQAEAEACVTVTGPEGTVEGWLEWEGERRLVFRPYEELAAGSLHYLRCQGSVAIASGARFALDRSVPFYPQTDAPPPLLLAADPPYGGIVGTDAGLSLRFSQPMDRLTVEREFAISPNPDIEFSWSESDTAVLIRAKEKWANLSLHEWSLPTTAKSAAGVRCVRSYASSFLTQSDTAPPSLAYSGPGVETPGGGWRALSPDRSLTLDDITNDQQIFIEFDEEVEYRSVVSAFKIEPSDASGYLVQAGPAAFVYTRSGPLLAGQEYLITLGKGIRDMAGNASPEDIRIEFVADIVQLDIDEFIIVNEGGAELSLTRANLQGLDMVNDPMLNFYGAGPEYSMSVRLRLSAASPGFPELSQAQRQAFALTVLVEPVFPLDLVPPSLSIFSWTDERTLTFAVDGLAVSTATRPAYYSFSILSGNPDAHDEAGSVLEEDFSFYLEAPIQ